MSKMALGFNTEVLWRSPRWHLTPFAVLCVIFLRLTVVTILVSRPMTEDATLYHEAAVHYAQVIHAGGSPPRVLEGWGIGVESYGLLTGWFYSVLGPNPLWIMLFNTTLAGIGSFIFLGIILNRYPGAHPLLKLLIVMDPSMLFWTSIHGKDPIMFFCFALATRSFGGMLRGRKSAPFWYVAALVPIVLIRFHLVPGVIFAGFAGLRAWHKKHPWPNWQTRTAYAISSTVVIFMIAALVFVALTIPLQTIISYYSTLIMSITYGGSALDLPEVTSIGGIFSHVASGIIAVLFRPFVWESGSLPFRIAALYEFLVWAAILPILARIMLRRRDKLVASPLPLFFAICGGSTLLVLAALAANVGTIFRVRVQFTVFFWLLLAALSSSPPVMSLYVRVRQQRREGMPNPRPHISGV